MTSATLTQDELNQPKPSFLQRYGLYIALAAAWIAMSGSYYMSEVLDWTPCWWCWMQRIMMYPNAIILALGLILKDRKLPALSLGLAGVGIPMSIWHILIQKVPTFTKLETCKPGESCAVDYLIRVGIPFVTIPMLALTAFVIIAVMCLIALRRPEAAALEPESEDAPRPLFSPAILVPLVVVPIAALFFISGYINKGNSATSDINGITNGEQLYARACASCHSTNGKLIRNSFLNQDDFALVSFVNTGRSVSDPNNLSGQPMPPKGNKPDLTPQQILAILKYMREIKK